MLKAEKLAEKFKRLDLFTRRSTVVQEEPEPYDPVKEQEEWIATMAQSRECKEGFIPYLEGLIEIYDTEESQNIESHSKMSSAQGKKFAIKQLRKKLKEKGEE